MKVVEGLMHNLVKDWMSVLEIISLLYGGSHVAVDTLGLIGKKEVNKFEKKKPSWQRGIEKSSVEWHQDFARLEPLRR